MKAAKANFGDDLIASLEEARAHRRGEISLPMRIVDPMSAKRVKAIRTALARSPGEFEKRFGVPARTIEGWEQGRKLDVASTILMTVIEHAPEAVEAALAKRPMT